MTDKTEDLKLLGLQPFDEIEEQSKQNGTYPRRSGRTIYCCYEAAIALREPDITVTIWGHTFSYTSELYNQTLHFAKKLGLDTTRLRKTFCSNDSFEVEQWWRGREESKWRVFIDHYRHETLIQEAKDKPHKSETSRLRSKIKTFHNP